LLPAAVEGMRDPSAHGMLSELLQHRVLRPTQMKDDRKLETLSDAKLGNEEAQLLLTIGLFDEMIEADLSDRNTLRAA